MTISCPNKTPRNHSRRFLILSVALYALAVCSCVAPRPGKSLGIPPMEPAAHHIEDVPFYPAEGKRCGPAALAGILSYYELDVDPDDIATKVMESEDVGTYHQDIYLYAVGRGMNAQIYSGGIRDLKRMIAIDRPVMILLDLGIIGEPQGHWVLVVGYDEEHLYLNDALTENREASRIVVYQAWKKTDYLTILILSPKTLLPPTSDQLAVRGLEAEAAGDWAAAEMLYRLSLERGDVKVGAIIGVGNTRLHLGDPEMAIAWYRLALRNEPGRGDALINMAAAYLELGNTRKAANLIERALENPASPYRAYAYDTLGDIMRARGRDDRALEAYRMALESPPADDSVFETKVRKKIEALDM